MLSGLSIRDVVLIDRLDLTFSAGLGVVTGETGAGKSILLDALGLALGARGDLGLVRNGADQAVVTASFDLSARHPARALLHEQDIDDEDTLILRRQIGRDGRSRAFVNDRPVSVAFLRMLGDSLVEIHGQHDDRGLLDQGGHRALLDSFAGNDDLLQQCRMAHIARQDAQDILEKARADLAKARADEDYLRHVTDELNTLAPEAGEEQRLADERQHLIAADKLASILVDVSALIDGDGGALAKLIQAQRKLERSMDQADKGLIPTLEALSRAIGETGEASDSLASAARSFVVDSRKLERVEERLFALRAAARKHHVTCDQLQDLAVEFATKLAAIDHGGTEMVRLQAQADAAQAKYRAIAAKLSAIRVKAAQELDKSVANELKPLKLDRAKFRTLVETMDEGGAEGLDRVSFEIATNPGAPFGPLIKIASGGELSRFILALKVSLARQGAAETLVFDEVDRGIGGAVAAAVGERLKTLSTRAQVLVVTHSPQVAARADHHWRISKSEKAGRAITRVEPLEAHAALEEIARMIAGAVITDEARAAAAALVAGARQ